MLLIHYIRFNDLSYIVRTSLIKFILFIFSHYLLLILTLIALPFYLLSLFLKLFPLIFLISLQLIMFTVFNRSPEVTYNYVEILFTQRFPRIYYIFTKQITLVMLYLPCLPSALTLLWLIYPNDQYFLACILLLVEMLYYSTLGVLKALRDTCITDIKQRIMISILEYILIFFGIGLVGYALLRGAMDFIISVTIIEYTFPVISLFLLIVSLLNFLLSCVIFDKEVLVLRSVRLRR